MGLDVYFCKQCGPGQTAEIVPFDDPQPALCGGMLSGDGASGSFRGKVYAPFVEEVGGKSLYEDYTPDDCLATGKLIDGWLDEAEGDQWTFQWEVTRQELRDLARCMNAYGEAGYGTWAWY